jgi:hypothetical protein
MSAFSFLDWVNHQNVHQSKDIKCALGKRGELRSVWIWKAFFSTDFMKIKFVELSPQNTQIIHD